MRIVTIAVASTVVAVTGFVAYAAELGLASARAAGGQAAIARCDTDGFTVSYSVSGSNVNSVTVAGIADPGCEGASVAVTVTNSAGGSISSGTGVVPTDADTLDNSSRSPSRPPAPRRRSRASRSRSPGRDHEAPATHRRGTRGRHPGREQVPRGRPRS